MAAELSLSMRDCLAQKGFSLCWTDETFVTNTPRSSFEKLWNFIFSLHPKCK